MPEAHRSSHLAVGYGGNPPSGFYDVDELAPSAQTAGANGNKSSHTQNRVHYVTALPGSGKTHLLCAIGQELIARGRRIYFTTSALLVQDPGT
jgi:chromosomal replication initiation ATPase DnaA